MRRVRFSDGAALDIDLEPRGFALIRFDVTMKSARDKFMPIGVDEISGNVLAHGHAAGARQVEVHAPLMPERDFCHADYGPRLKSIARKESFRGEHSERVDIVNAFSVTAATRLNSFQLLDETVTAATMCFVFIRESRLTFVDQKFSKPLDLAKRPLQAAAQTQQHIAERFG